MTTFHKIVDKCYELFGKQYCFHYANMNEYEQYYLFAFQHIDGKLVEYEGNDLINPWNTLTRIHPDYADQVRSEHPPTKQQPIFDNRIMIQTDILDRSKAEEYVSDMVGADYWGAYIRKSDTLEVLEIIYDITNDRGESRESGESDKGRTDLMENTSKYFDKMADDEELVLVGNHGFCEIYVRKVDNHYIYIVVSPPNGFSATDKIAT